LQLLARFFGPQSALDQLRDRQIDQLFTRRHTSTATIIREPWHDCGALPQPRNCQSLALTVRLASRLTVPKGQVSRESAPIFDSVRATDLRPVKCLRHGGDRGARETDNDTPLLPLPKNRDRAAGDGWWATSDPSAGSGQAPSAGSGQAPSAGSGQAPSAGSGQALSEAHGC
jgi:hypothetical protein